MSARLVLALFGTMACGKSTPKGDDPATDTGASTDTSTNPCDTGLVLTWQDWGEGFFLNYCTSCHGVDTPDRYDAPEGVNFDTLDDVGTWEARIRVRALDEQTMPVGGGVHEEDLAFLERFLDCGLDTNR